MSLANEMIIKKEIHWTPRLIRQLRGRRTLAEFATLVEAATNTVWRWEDGRSEPDGDHMRLLSELAERERFLKDWQLGGSRTLAGDIDAALSKSSADLRKTVAHRTRDLQE